MSKSDEELQAEFQDLCRPLCRFLMENYHPHTSVILTNTGAQLLEGVLCTYKDLEEEMLDLLGGS